MQNLILLSAIKVLFRRKKKCNRKKYKWLKTKFNPKVRIKKSSIFFCSEEFANCINTSGKNLFTVSPFIKMYSRKNILVNSYL